MERAHILTSTQLFGPVKASKLEHACSLNYAWRTIKHFEVLPSLPPLALPLPTLFSCLFLYLSYCLWSLSTPPSSVLLLCSLSLLLLLFSPPVCSSHVFIYFPLTFLPPLASPYSLSLVPLCSNPPSPFISLLFPATCPFLYFYLSSLSNILPSPLTVLSFSPSPLSILSSETSTVSFPVLPSPCVSYHSPLLLSFHPSLPSFLPPALCFIRRWFTTTPY